MATPDAESRFERLSDRDLLLTVETLRRRERTATAELIEALAEIDRRALYLGAGFASLFTYCTNRLGLSEFEAYLRMQAARTVKAYPLALEMLMDGRLTITAISLIANDLSADNYPALLEAASNKSKREILDLLASLHPKPDTKSLISKIPTGAVLSDQPDGGADVSGNCGNPDPETLVDAARAAFERSAITPLTPERYKLQVTLSREAHEILRRLQALMRHTVPNGDPAPIVERALQMLLGDIERRTIARTERPHRVAPCRSGTRYVPWQVRRDVWARDGEQCAFIGATGRCLERAFLEFHHVVPYAEGGSTTVENLELRCRAHNAYEAELFFGIDFDVAIAEPPLAETPLEEGSSKQPGGPDPKTG